MSLSLLHHYAEINENNPKSDSKGVVMPPLLMIEPSMYVVPILHLLIGLVNKVWSSMILFLDKFVESIGTLEAKLKENVEYHEEAIEDIIDKIEIQTVNKNLASAW